MSGEYSCRDGKDTLKRQVWVLFIPALGNNLSPPNIECPAGWEEDLPQNHLASSTSAQ